VTEPSTSLLHDCWPEFDLHAGPRADLPTTEPAPGDLAAAWRRICPLIRSAPLRTPTLWDRPARQHSGKPFLSHSHSLPLPAHRAGPSRASPRAETSRSTASAPAPRPWPTTTARWHGARHDRFAYPAWSADLAVLQQLVNNLGGGGPFDQPPSCNKDVAILARLRAHRRNMPCTSPDLLRHRLPPPGAPACIKVRLQRARQLPPRSLRSLPLLECGRQSLEALAAFEPTSPGLRFGVGASGL